MRDGFRSINGIVREELASGEVALAGERVAQLDGRHPQQLVEMRGDEALYHMTVGEIMAGRARDRRSPSRARVVDMSLASPSAASSVDLQLSVDKSRTKSASPYRRTGDIHSSDVIERIRARTENRELMGCPLDHV